MSAALRDVLNFAALDKEEEVGEVNLDGVLSDVLADLELVISEKRATVNYSSLPVLKAIRHQMQQLFYNLLNNAVKFSHPDVVPVVSITSRVLTADEIVRHENLNRSKSYCQIMVQDNGIGFDQDAADKIFGMFQRLYNKDKNAGTGIGLALVQKVVKNHGGKVWAESTPGEGATFNVLLPIG